MKLRRPIKVALVAFAAILVLGVVLAVAVVSDIARLVNGSMNAPRSAGSAAQLTGGLRIGMSDAEMRVLLDRHHATFAEQRHTLPIPGIPYGLARLIPGRSSVHTLMADFHDGHLNLTTDEGDVLAGILYLPNGAVTCMAAFHTLATHFATHHAAPGTAKAEHVQIWPAENGGVVYLSVRTTPLCMIVAGKSPSADAAGCESGCHRKE